MVEKFAQTNVADAQVAQPAVQEKFKRSRVVYDVVAGHIKERSNPENLAGLLLSSTGLELTTQGKVLSGFGRTKAIFCNGICVGYITMSREYNGRIKVTIVNEENSLGVDIIEAAEILKQFS